ARLEVMVLDKTGTITQGNPAVTAIHCTAALDADTVLQLAASLETGSEHALAQAMTGAARDKQLTLSAVENFSAIPGQGVCGTLQNQSLLFGNRKLMQENHIDLQAHEARAQQLA